jgi:hypothetical protein
MKSYPRPADVARRCCRRPRPVDRLVQGMPASGRARSRRDGCSIGRRNGRQPLPNIPPRPGRGPSDSPKLGAPPRRPAGDSLVSAPIRSAQKHLDISLPRLVQTSPSPMASMRSPVQSVTPEATRPAAENYAKLPGLRTGLSREREAERSLQLREAWEQCIERIVGHLRAAGATEDDIGAARPGLISARLALDPIESVLDTLTLVLLLAVIGAYVWFPEAPEFVRRGGFLLYPLFWASDWNHALAEATRYVFGVGMGIGLLFLLIYHNPLTRMRVLSGPTLAQEAAKRSKRVALVNSLDNWLFIPLLFGLVIMIAFSWKWGTSALSFEREATWWDDILVALCSIWSLMLCSFLFRHLPGLRNAIQYYRFPGFTLLNALSEALDAVRDRHLWFDLEHRLIIARELAKAADILEGPMLQRFIGETGSRGATVLGPRFATVAAGVRRKLIWVATPMSETRQDLERFLRDAVIAVAVGQIDAIGRDEAAEPEARVGRLKVWLPRLVAFAKSAAIAIIPCGLVWLALKCGFITLSSEADKATAQNAAVVWFVLSMVRMLDPGSFKDISDASGGWTERLSRSLGRNSR